MIASKEGVSFREMITGGRFYYGAEIVTTRGLPPPGDLNPPLELARACLADPRIGWISITDNPGGTPMLPPDWLGGMVRDRATNVVVHLTCKDMNRNGLEAAAWRYAGEGFDNLLAITGDYPAAGYGGLADPVFDLDSVGLVALLRSMNEGLKVPGRKGDIQTLSPTRFFIGCAVSPFKRHENELLPQYFKLLRKIQAGAQWVIPQLGYDMRKFHEVKLYLALRGVEAPIVGNVYLLNRAVARLFNSGKLAGCVVSDALLQRIEKYAAGPDKGRVFCQELAAQQLAVFKGLGFAAGYLGGIAKAETFAAIIDQAESYGPDDWKDFVREIQFSQPDEFFLFDHDSITGLPTSPVRINPDYQRSLDRPVRTKNVTLGYRLSRRVHQWAFSRGKGLYGLMTRLFRRWDRKPGWLMGMAYWLEKEAKFLGYGCQDCGDCSLPDCAYLCPLAACSKHSRNGPCGGSRGGRCELDDKQCFWARVYDRLKYYGQSQEMFASPPVLYDAALKHTSSWANTYLDRDHHAPAEEQTPQPAAQGTSVSPGGHAGTVNPQPSAKETSKGGNSSAAS